MQFLEDFQGIEAVHNINLIAIGLACHGFGKNLKWVTWDYRGVFFTSFSICVYLFILSLRWEAMNPDMIVRN